MKNSPPINFSPEQLRAINHFRGPALVVAGPGSGKTAVITRRIYKLIDSYHVNPQKILVITFSKAAALHMQQRFNDMLSDKSLPVCFGTFHSLFFSIIKKHKHLTKDNIVTEKEKRRYIYDILSDLLQYKNCDSLFIDNIIKAISYCKNTGEKYPSEDVGLSADEFIKIYKSYTNIMSYNNKIDFDDMMLLCFKILSHSHNLRNEYKDKFSFLLIDEFQDINSLQYNIIKLLLNDEKNIFAVGDDDQSIYGFRGAAPEIMSLFPKDFCGCETIILSTNYRSTQNIVRLSEMLINENKNRYKKQLRTDNPVGKANFLYIAGNKNVQSRMIVDYVCDAIKREENSTVAVLFRTNSNMSLVSGLLGAKNIPFYSEIKGDLTEVNILRDFVAYLALSNSDKIFETKYLYRIINKPYRYVELSMIQGETISAPDLKKIFSDDEGVLIKIRKLIDDLDILKGLDMYGAFSYFLKIIGYNGYLNDRFREDKEKLFLLEGILEGISEKMRSFCCVEEIIEYIAFKEYEKPLNNNDEARISLLTFHSAKGLEFDYVLIPDLNEGIIPEKRAKNLEQIEEERRMLYVAFTRAKRELVLMYVKDDIKKKTFSRFLKPLINNEELLEIKNVSGLTDTFT